ncbi:unnamed protein product, partial [Mesorhabditis belari]|uniref:Potassium channel domain-containing protein n=1 Tax=Mesorhabditis belari TaxID=2138241 RepID=A0AAF3EEA7_9BILA
MARRNAIRQKKSFLDDEQTKDALKILGKYVKVKYGGMIGGLNGSNANLMRNDSEQFPPLSRAKTAERQPTIASTPFSENGPLSPHYSEGPSVKEEIKFDRNRESLAQYIRRLIVFFYNYLGLQHLLLLFILICYALIGGYVFQTLEEPFEKKLLLEKAKISLEFRFETAQKLVDFVKMGNCSKKLVSRNFDKNLSMNRSISDCEWKMIEMIREFEKALKKQWGINEQWKWDFWNAVFYSGTLFTTIGYGNLACRTDYGRLATILYTLLGIPLMLMVLDSLGKAMFTWIQIIYLNFRRKLRNRVRTVKKVYLKRSATVESVSSDEVQPFKSPTECEDLFKTFPLKLAIPIIFLYCFICSLIFCKWEDEWDYFTSFYFFFISLTTVGLGDVMPQHPRFASALFLAFIIGLALVSMCVSLMHQRVENRYMAALQLIDQEHLEALEAQRENEGDVDGETPKPTIAHRNDVILRAYRKNSIRLSTTSLNELKGGGGNGNGQQRGSMFGINISAWLASTPNSIRYRNSPSTESNRESCISPDNGPPSAILGLLHSFSRQTSLSKNLKQYRSENISRPNSLRPFSFNSEMDLMSSDRSPLPTPDFSLLTPGSSRSTASAPNLTQNRQSTQPLSVITEGEEDSLISRGNSRKKKSLKRQTSEEKESLDQTQPQLLPPSEGSLARRRSIDPPKSLSLSVEHRSESISDRSVE